MFKNQLQELAQRSCYNMPSYSCIKEGPDHAPKFKATVNFNGEVFESPGYFSTLRHAEHAAAEIALKGLQAKSSPHSLAMILDESGVCKNLLQENAQRAGVPLPVYSTRKSGPGHQPVFTCTVEVAAMQFAGEPAKTKKQAEKNAALAAWTALRKKAGKRSAAPVEDSDVTDEQEQKLIADILKNNLSEKQPIKSSPAALAENHHHRAGVSPALLPSAPLYTRQPIRGMNSGAHSSQPGPAPVQASPSPATPVYTRHYGRIHPEEQVGSASVSSTSSHGPVYKPRHINAHWVGQQVSASGVSQMRIPEGQAVGSNLFGITQAHSCPQVHSHNAMAMRSHLPPGAVKPELSLPAFPTQPLAAPSMPHTQPPVLPRSQQVLQQPLGTTSHTGLAIRPGMAYQPRMQGNQFVAGPPVEHQGSSWAGGPQQPPVARSHAAPVWREQSHTWAAPHQPRACGHLGAGIPPAMVTGNRAQGQDEEDDAPDAQQVEHTTRLMLSHLCLE